MAEESSIKRPQLTNQRPEMIQIYRRCMLSICATACTFCICSCIEKPLGKPRVIGGRKFGLLGEFLHGSFSCDASGSGIVGQGEAAHVIIPKECGSGELTHSEQIGDRGAVFIHGAELIVGQSTAYRAEGTGRHTYGIEAVGFIICDHSAGILAKVC